MFEALVVRRPANAAVPFDAGALAEALLFYQNVHLLLDRDALENSMRTIGLKNLIRLLESEHAKATFIRQAVATTTDQVGMFQKHRFVEYELHGHGRELRSKLELIEDCIRRALGNEVETAKSANRLNDLIPWRNLSDGVHERGGLCTLALQDLRDSEYCRKSIEVVLQGLVPDYTLPPGFHFSVYEKRGQFFVGTNLDFNEIGVAYRAGHNTESPFTVPYLANFIFDARADYTLACQYSAEMMTTSTTSKLIQLRVSEWAHRRMKSAAELELFQSAHLENGRALKEVINAKERSFEELLDLLDKSVKFKSMLRNANPDRGLAQEYFLASTRDTWVDKLPAKTLRFCFFTGSGLLADLAMGGGLGTAAGLTVSLFDSFLFDKFVKGWKPNHFVSSTLSDFVSPRK